jgi:hypothetical protein
MLTLPKRLGSEPQVETSVNLVKNPGFEKDDDGNNLPDEWTVIRGNFALDSGMKYKEGRSLRATTADPGVNPAVCQTVLCRQHNEYYFRAWVRGQGVAGAGAGVFMDWFDGAGRYIAGQYPAGLAGSFEWTLVEDRLVIPDGAASVRFGCHLLPGTTGTVWFDATGVEPVVPGPLRVYVKRPHYRGFVIPPVEAPFEAQLLVTRSGTWGARDATVRSELRDSGGRVVAKSEAVFAPAETVKTLQLQPPKNLPLGDYRWWFGLYAQLQQVRLIDESEYGVRSRRAMPGVHFDERGRTIVNGEPFFPLGVYMGTTEDEHLRRIAAAGFNTLLSYGHGLGEGAAPEQSTPAFFDRAQRHGLRVFYHTLNFYEGFHYVETPHPSGLDAARYYVTRLRNHPALLAYYTADEPSYSLGPKLQDMYNMIVETDIHHPCFQVNFLGDIADRREVSRIIEFFHDTLDVQGVDPYVIPCNPLELVAVWTEGALDSTRGVKPVWVVPQMFDPSAYGTTDRPPAGCLEPRLREPTLEEKRCMAYLALTAGAKGLIFYNYYDLFRTTGGVVLPPTDPLVQRRFAEFHQLGRELHSVTPPLLRWEPFEPAFAPAATPVRHLSLRLGKSLLFLLANPTRQPRSVRVTLPPGDWREVKFRHGGLTGALSGARLDVTLPAVGSGDVLVSAA